MDHFPLSTHPRRDLLNVARVTDAASNLRFFLIKTEGYNDDGPARPAEDTSLRGESSLFIVRPSLHFTQLPAVTQVPLMVPLTAAPTITQEEFITLNGITLGRFSVPGASITVDAKPVSYTPDNTDVVLATNTEGAIRASSWGPLRNGPGRLMILLAMYGRSLGERDETERKIGI